MSDTPRYEPSAELVERLAQYWHENDLMPGDEPRFQKRQWADLPNIVRERKRHDVRTVLAASGLGEAVEVLRKALSLVGDFKVVTSAEKAIAEEIRALLARLDPRT